MTDEKARDAAFEKVKRTTTTKLGLWDASQGPCIYDHKKIWTKGFDAGYAAGAEDERERIKTVLSAVEDINRLRAFVDMRRELEGKQDGK